MFEPTLNLFSRYVSTVGSKMTVLQLAGVRRMLVVSILM